MASLGSDGTGKLDVVVLKKLNDDMEKLQADLLESKQKAKDLSIELKSQRKDNLMLSQELKTANADIEAYRATTKKLGQMQAKITEEAEAGTGAVAHAGTAQGAAEPLTAQARQMLRCRARSLQCRSQGHRLASRLAGRGQPGAFPAVDLPLWGCPLGKKVGLPLWGCPLERKVGLPL